MIWLLGGEGCEGSKCREEPAASQTGKRCRAPEATDNRKTPPQFQRLLSARKNPTTSNSHFERKEKRVNPRTTPTLDTSGQINPQRIPASENPQRKAREKNALFSRSEYLPPPVLPPNPSLPLLPNNHQILPPSQTQSKHKGTPPPPQTPRPKPQTPQPLHSNPSASDPPH